jgi:hypothetical protein
MGAKHIRSSIAKHTYFVPTNKKYIRIYHPHFSDGLNGLHHENSNSLVVFLSRGLVPDQEKPESQRRLSEEQS